MAFDQNTSGYGWIDYFHLIRSRWTIMLFAGSVVLLSGASLHRHSPSLSESTIQIQWEAEKPDVGIPLSNTSAQASASNRISRVVAELKDRDLLAEVSTECSLGTNWNTGSEGATLALLEKRIRLEVFPEEHILNLSLSDLSPDSSALLANTLADHFFHRKMVELESVATEKLSRLQSELEVQRKGVETIQARLVEIGSSPSGSEIETEDLRRELIRAGYLIRALEAKHLLATVEVGDIQLPFHLLSRADAAHARLVRPFLLKMPILILLGLAVGILVVVMIERGQTRLAFLSKMNERLRVTISGFAPVSGESLLRSRIASPILVEAYRSLRTKLLRLPAGECLLMTLLPMRGRDEGIAEVVANLAAVLSDAGKMVLVIDADFRQPRLHVQFEAANYPGFSDFLSGEIRLEEAVLKCRRPNLWFMPSGPLHDDPSGLISGRRMGDLLWYMRSRFDFILIVSPAIDEVSDAGALVALSDFTTLVAPHPESSLSRLEKSRLAIEAASARLTAVFLTTKAESRTSAAPHGYSGAVETSLRNSGESSHQSLNASK